MKFGNLLLALIIGTIFLLLIWVQFEQTKCINNVSEQQTKLIDLETRHRAIESGHYIGE